MSFLSKIAATFIFPVAAIILVFCASWSHDPGITSDSTFYLETAGNIIAGKGLTDDYGRVNAHWPPLYPIILAGASRVTGMDCITSGTFLNALIVGLMFLVFNLILAKILITPWFRWSANLFLLVSLPLTVFTMFWSEVPFMLLLMMVILFGLNWIKTASLRWLILAGIFSGLLILTRYAGVGFTAGFVVYLLFFSGHDYLTRIRNVLIYAGLAGLLVSPWVIFVIASGGAEIRSFNTHMITPEHFATLFRTFYSWLLPEKFGIPGIVFGPFFLTCFLVAAYMYRKYYISGAIFKRFDITGKELALFLLSLSIFYLFMLITSISFFDAHTQLNNRILSPLYALLLILIMIILENVTARIQVKVPVFILLGSLLISNAVYNGRLWHRHFVEGSGYRSLEWQGSATLLAVKSFTGYVIYTNAPDVITLNYPGLTGRVRNIPLKTNANTGLANRNYTVDLERMKASVESGEGVIIYFNRFTARDYFIPKEELLQIFIKNDIQLEDGLIVVL